MPIKSSGPYMFVPICFCYFGTMIVKHVYLSVIIHASDELTSPPLAFLRNETRLFVCFCLISHMILSITISIHVGFLRK